MARIACADTSRDTRRLLDGKSEIALGDGSVS